ncbi:MAG: hypothetical protein ACFCUS_02750 [Rubrimonas sp.]
MALPRGPAAVPALDLAEVAERLGVDAATLAAALLRAQGEDAPTPLGLRPARGGNRGVLRAAVEGLREGRALIGVMVAAQPPSQGLRGFAHLTEELEIRAAALAAERSSARALEAERDRARVIAEVIAEDVGAPAGRIASRLGALLRAPDLVGSASARQALEAASEEVWRLLDTVATVLEHGARAPVEIEAEPVDLAACIGEALSRLRAAQPQRPAPFCALGPQPLRALGDWRLTPLLFQRCLTYVAQRAAPTARLELRATLGRPGAPLTLDFRAEPPRRERLADAPGSAMLLAVRDLARTHGWEAAPALDAPDALTLVIPADRLAVGRDGDPLAIPRGVDG